MSRVDDLLAAYVSAYRAGEADPSPFLAGVTGAERAQLAALIDGFLAAAPPPAFDPAAFEAFASEPARRELVRDVLAPSLLELRQAAGLSSAEVGARLADALELGPGRASASTVVFHEIEAGLVEPRRVRARVWDALAGIYTESVERLRRAAEAAFEARGPSGAPVYTRMAAPAAAAPPAAARRPAPAPDPDERAVREAFLEGG